MEEKPLSCVLLADRHHGLTEGMRGLLATAFGTVVMVADKASLFDTAEKLNPDLAVVDLSLPVSGEINIARQLKDKYPNNLHYISNFIENSIRLETYDEIYPHIERLRTSENSYYQYLGEIFLDQA